MVCIGGNSLKAMLLRVGIDKGTDGALGPVFEDGSFEYIPISENPKWKTTSTKTYRNTIGRTGKSLSCYLPEPTWNRLLHYDPEFQTYTYGDATPKREYLLRLQPDDLLVFYAGLAPFGTDRRRTGLYIIGYFFIEEIVDFDKLLPKEEQYYRRHYGRNAHLKASQTAKLVIAAGKPHTSALLRHAIPISETRPDKRGRPNMVVSRRMESLLGIRGSIQRSLPPRFITGKTHVENLRRLILFEG
jgi:hypothetical protein